MSTLSIDQIIDTLPECATSTDQEPGDLREFLSSFIAAGGVDFGLSESSSSFAAQSQIIRSVAENCVSSAFVVWSHRMTTEYIDRWATQSVRTKYLPELLSGSRIGSTALATALAFTRVLNVGVGAWKFETHRVWQSRFWSPLARFKCR